MRYGNGGFIPDVRWHSAPPAPPKITRNADAADALKYAWPLLPPPTAPLVTKDAEERRVLEDHRAEKRRQEERERERIERMERARQKAALLRRRLMSTHWVTRDGETIPVSKMTPRHAQNAVRFAQGIARNYYAAEVAAGSGAGTYRSSWPLINALQKRAAQEPSLRDRVVDKVNGRQYRKRSTSGKAIR